MWEFSEKKAKYPTYMLQLKIILGYSIFKLVYFFQNQVNLSQSRSIICLNLDQFGAAKKHRSQATSHRSLLANTGSILKLTIGLIRPKQKFIGLISAYNSYENNDLWLVGSDLRFLPAPNWSRLKQADLDWNRMTQIDLVWKKVN